MAESPALNRVPLNFRSRPPSSHHSYSCCRVRDAEQQELHQHPILMLHITADILLPVRSRKQRVGERQDHSCSRIHQQPSDTNNVSPEFIHSLPFIFKDGLYRIMLPFSRISWRYCRVQRYNKRIYSSDRHSACSQFPDIIQGMLRNLMHYIQHNRHWYHLRFREVTSIS